MVDERTFVAVKRDGVMRGLIGNIIGQFEKRGLKLVALKLKMPSKELVEAHYSEHAGKPFFDGLVQYMSSGPVCAMVWQGEHAVQVGRVIIGATYPVDAEPQSIRGGYAREISRNVCHGSDTVESAEREVRLWFEAGEIAKNV